jgi:hypothetical protein
MFSKTTVALSAAIIFSTATVPASAATKHHRVTHTNSAIYMSPGDGTCSPIHPPLCSNICSGAGPCAPPDSW